MTDRPTRSSLPSLRAIPSVDRMLREIGPTDLPRPVVVAVVRRVLAELREGGQGGGAGPDHALSLVRSSLEALRAARVRRVINGTGILVHTNLGRSPLGDAVVEAVRQAAADYNNLEYDLTRGGRGGRAAYLEHNLAVLCGATGADDPPRGATVVNNCAAALVLILRHFAGSADRNEVVISRGELVQIGGGFRVPEILESGGAALREVGTTNRTSIEDYERAIGPRTALVLKVHRSNFFMGGFVESPPTAAIAEVARAKDVPFVEDLGSGATVATEAAAGVEHEPTPPEVLDAGADLVCFSGDKLLGGPQAGVIAGRREMVAALKKEPLFRALRCDKLVLAALQATADQHLSEQAAGADLTQSGVPVVAMMHASPHGLRRRAEGLVAALAGLPLAASVGRGEAQVGGGTLPRSVIPSVTLDLLPQATPLLDFAARLRAGEPAVVGYVSGGRFKLDLRTVFPRQDAELLAALRAAAASH
jgi:L-seryl-tRNA(Ser) seleniumtransferase